MIIVVLQCIMKSWLVQKSESNRIVKLTADPEFAEFGSIRIDIFYSYL